MRQKYLPGVLPLSLRVRLVLSGTNVALLVSLLALSLSAFNTFRLYFYEREDLRLRVDGGVYGGVGLAFTNAGTRDAYVSGFSVVAPTGDGNYCFASDKSEGNTGFVLKPGEIKIQNLFGIHEEITCNGTKIDVHAKPAKVIIGLNDWRGKGYSVAIDLGGVEVQSLPGGGMSVSDKDPPLVTQWIPLFDQPRHNFTIYFPDEYLKQ